MSPNFFKKSTNQMTHDLLPEKLEDLTTNLINEAIKLIQVDYHKKKISRHIHKKLLMDFQECLCQIAKYPDSPDGNVNYRLELMAIHLIAFYQYLLVDKDSSTLKESFEPLITLLDKGKKLAINPDRYHKEITIDNSYYYEEIYVDELPTIIPANIPTGQAVLSQCEDSMIKIKIHRKLYHDLKDILDHEKPIKETNEIELTDSFYIPPGSSV